MPIYIRKRFIIVISWTATTRNLLIL